MSVNIHHPHTHIHVRRDITHTNASLIVWLWKCVCVWDPFLPQMKIFSHILPLAPRLSWDPMGISKNLAGPSEGRFCTHDRLQRGKTDSSGHFWRPTAANVECCSKWARETKKAAEVDRSRLSLYHTISVSFAFFSVARAGKSGHFADTLSREGGPYPEPSDWSGIFASLFLCFSSFWPKSFRRENLIFSRPDFFAKKKLVRRRSFLFLASLVHTPSTTITIYHKLNVRTSRFFFLRPIQHAANSSRTTFSATFCPNLSRNPFNFTVPPSYRGYCVELFFPLEYPRPNFTSKKIHTTLFSLGWPRGWGCWLEMQCRGTAHVLQ